MLYTQSNEANVHLVEKNEPIGISNMQEVKKSRINLALALTRLRKASGLTQKQLANKMNKDQSFISRMESKSGPSPDSNSIVSFAKACNFDTGYLFTLSDNEILAVSMNRSKESQRNFYEKMFKHNISPTLKI